LARAECQVRSTVVALRDRSASPFMVGGAICGPFLGVTFSLNALRYIEAGVVVLFTRRLSRRRGIRSRQRMRTMRVLLITPSCSSRAK